MPRSRSRSPKRSERRRSRSRSRERRRRSRRSRSRSPPPRYRSRSPVQRSRSRSPRRREGGREPGREGGRSSQTDKKPTPVEKPKIDESQLAGLNDEEREMMSLMGFANFDTTKGKKVEGNDMYATNLVRKRRYRQYMNRRGGFNRPLDFIA